MPSAAGTCWDHRLLDGLATHTNATVELHECCKLGVEFMAKVARRVGIAFGSFVIAWLAVSLVGGWLFGSANFLVWVIAAVVGAGVYVELLRRDRRVG